MHKLQLNIYALATEEQLAVAEELCAVAAKAYEYAAEHGSWSDFIAVVRFMGGCRDDAVVDKFIDVAKRALVS